MEVSAIKHSLTNADYEIWTCLVGVRMHRLSKESWMDDQGYGSVG